VTPAETPTSANPAANAMGCWPRAASTIPIAAAACAATMGQSLYCQRCSQDVYAKIRICPAPTENKSQPTSGWLNCISAPRAGNIAETVRVEKKLAKLPTHASLRNSVVFSCAPFSGGMASAVALDGLAVKATSTTTRSMSAAGI